MRKLPSCVRQIAQAELLRTESSLSTADNTPACKFICTSASFRTRRSACNPVNSQFRRYVQAPSQTDPA
ncbi:hypothetical protein VTL71DRAFT_7292 [Oculimacula yallundae]|uniref:Uncharacterized protein n=1 Tax=Oculimacula yallundae TaxID=86028 RepID=A0ABR4BW98_9HELO